MIRHFFLNKVTIICMMIFMIGCSPDSVTNDISIEETALEKQGPRIEVNLTMEILIEYVEGTSEEDKKDVRYNYINSGLLLGWTECEIDDVEVWEVDILIYHFKQPVAVPQTDHEVVEKSTIRANCNDYIGT